MAIKRVWPGTALSVDLRGDKTLSNQLVHQARIVAGNLFDSMRPGQTFREGWWHGDNGAFMKVYVWRTLQGDKALAQIYTEGGGEEFAKIYLEHGFIKGPDLVQIPDELLELQNVTGVSFAPITLSAYGAALSKKPPDFLANNWYKVRPEPTEKNKKKYIAVAREDLPLSYNNNPNKLFWDDLSRPHMYSGLMKLLAQAKLGVGVPFRKFWDENVLPVLPSFVSEYPLRNPCIGCIRSPTDDLWIVVFCNQKPGSYVIANMGIYACKLKFDPRLAPLRAIAKDAGYSQEIRDMAEAWCMAYASVEEGSAVTLADYENEDYKKFDGIEAHGHLWGLSWRYQHRGATDEYVSGVRTFFTSPARITLDLDFTWDAEDKPGFTVTSVEDPPDPPGHDPRPSSTRAVWFGHDGTKQNLTVYLGAAEREQENVDSYGYSYTVKVNDTILFESGSPRKVVAAGEALLEVTNSFLVAENAPPEWGGDHIDIWHADANLTVTETWVYDDPPTCSLSFPDAEGIVFLVRAAGGKTTVIVKRTYTGWAQPGVPTGSGEPQWTQDSFIWSEPTYYDQVVSHSDARGTDDDAFFYDGDLYTIPAATRYVTPAIIPPWSCTAANAPKWLYTSYEGQLATDLFPDYNPNGFTLDNRNCFVGGA